MWSVDASTEILLIPAKSSPFQPNPPHSGLAMSHAAKHGSNVSSTRILLKGQKDYVAFLTSSLKLGGNSWTSGKCCYFFGTFHTKRKIADLEALHFPKTGNVLFNIIKYAFEEPGEF